MVALTCLLPTPQPFMGYAKRVQKQHMLVIISADRICITSRFAELLICFVLKQVIYFSWVQCYVLKIEARRKSNSKLIQGSSIYALA